MSNDHIKVTCVGDDHITLTHTSESKEVMRITREGVYVADGVSVDEAAQAVLDTLSGHIQRMLDIARADDADEIERLHQQLAECEQERESFHMDYRMKCDAETKVLHEQLTAVTAEWDELVEALKLADYIINGSDRIGGLLCCMDGYYAGVMDEELAQFDVVLAKVGAGKTGDV